MAKFYWIGIWGSCILLLLGSCQNKKYLKAHSDYKKKRKRVYEEIWVRQNDIKLNVKKKNKTIICEDGVVVPVQDYNLARGEENKLYYGMFYTIRQKPNKRTLFYPILMSIYNATDTLKVKYIYDKKYEYELEDGTHRRGGYRSDTVYTTRVVKKDSIYYRKAKLRRFFMTKVGEAPTIFDPDAAKLTARSMQNYLIQQGYLNAKVGYKVDTVRRNRAHITYHYSTGKPLLIDTIIFESPDSNIARILKDIQSKSYLKRNQSISKTSFLAEKKRITYAIRNRGYQQFIPNYIAFEADTVNARQVKPKSANAMKIGAQGEKRAAIYVTVLPYGDTLIEHQKYTINDVFIVLDEPNIEIHKTRRRYIMDSSFVVLNPPRKKQEIDCVINAMVTAGDSLSYLELSRNDITSENSLFEDLKDDKKRSVLVIAGGKYPYWIRLKKQKKENRKLPKGKLIMKDNNNFIFVFPHKSGKYLSRFANTHKFVVKALDRDRVYNYEVTLKPYKRRFVRSSYPHENLIKEDDLPIQVILRQPAKTAIRDSAAAAKAIAQLKRKNYIIRDQIISRNVQLSKGSIYNYDAGRETINNITALDVFKFPRLEYVPSKSGSPDELDAYIFMQKADRHRWGTYTEFNTSRNVNNLGWALNLNYRNRNLFRGAEAFVFNIEGGIDFKIRNVDTTIQTRGIIRWINLLDINSNANIYFPEIVGFRNWSLSVENPRSKVTLSYRYLQQATDFRVSSFDALFGYEWTVKKKKHQYSWNPFILNFTLQPYLQPDFSMRLQSSNIALWLSLQERYFIPGGNFRYSRLPKNLMATHVFSYSFFAEMTGNSVWLLDQILRNRPINFLGIPYSQYGKLDMNIRYTLNVNKDHAIATRLMLGAALPFGNSSTVPYARRFFLGGPSSMRAWNMRHLGPGRMRPIEGAEFQLGDLRLEMNAEYRFMLNSWIGGAIFTDIGNIWLLRKPEQTATTQIPQLPIENGVINLNFWKELAMDAGLGLRLDMSFFVIRLDLAWQIHHPSGFLTNYNGNRQVVDRNGVPVYWSLGPANWVLAVGYPF